MSDFTGGGDSLCRRRRSARRFSGQHKQQRAKSGEVRTSDIPNGRNTAIISVRRVQSVPILTDEAGDASTAVAIPGRGWTDRQVGPGGGRFCFRIGLCVQALVLRLKNHLPNCAAIIHFLACSNRLPKIFICDAHHHILIHVRPNFSTNATLFRKMNRLFAASLLVALAAILLNAPAVAAGKSVLAQDPTQGQDTFGNIRVGRLLKVRA